MFSAFSFHDFQAAARHHCNYLVYLHSAHFLRVGGDPLWLQGLEAAPAHLRLLDHINKVLAHQPWLTACSHIQVQQNTDTTTTRTNDYHLQ